MRPLLLLLSVAFASPAFASSPPEDLLARLRTLGYFAGMAPAQEQRCLADIREAGTPWGLSCSRVVEADAEELAEGAFPEVFRAAAPLLASRKAPAAIPRTESSARQYTVYTDAGHPIPLYDFSGSRDKYDAWERASLLFLAITNLRLKKAGSSERFYRVYSANEQLFVLLTPSMYAAIGASSLPVEDQPEPLPESLR